MRLNSSKIPLKLASLTLFLMAFGLTGCGTRHVLQTAGQTGVILRKGSAFGAFPDEKGNLTPGEIELAPGTLVRVPLNEQEVIDALKAAGVKFNDH